jgi:perosamine synthetase
MRSPQWRQVAPTVNEINIRALVNAVGNARHELTLREMLCERFSALECVLVDSGTSALTLAIEHCVPVGESVALPAFGCFDLVTALMGAKRAVEFYDLDPMSLSPNIADLERTLSTGVRAVVVAPLYGYAPDMTSISQLCERLGVAIIMDCAQSLASAWQGRPLASFGTVSTVSFGRGKEIGGGGGGAMLLHSAGTVGAPRLPEPSKPVVAAKLAALVAQYVLASPLLFGLPSSLPWLGLGTTVYRPPTRAARISRMQSVVAIAGLRRLDAIAAARRVYAERLMTGGLSGSKLRFVHIQEGSSFGALRLAALAPALDARTMARTGIRRSYPQTLPTLYASLISKESRSFWAAPGADVLAQWLVTLPTHHRMSPGDLHNLNAVVGAFRLAAPLGGAVE